MDFIFDSKNIQGFAIWAEPFLSWSFVFTKSSCFNLEIMGTYPKFCNDASNSKVLHIVKVGLKLVSCFKRGV